jgi:site-specific DNA recombinase
MLTLNNVTYTGKTHWKAANEPESSRIVRQGQHEAIISTETFNKAQRILTRRREGLISLNSYEYVFGGIIKCAKCGGSFSGKYNKRNLLDGSPALYRGYVCSNNEKRGTCDQSGISEANVTKLLFERFNSLEELNQFFTHFKNDDGKAINDNRKELEKQIQQSEARRKRWQLAYGDGNMPYEDFSARMAEEVVKMKEWHIQLDQFPPIVSEVTPQEAFESIKDIRDNWQYFEQSTKKQIIQALFQKIAINKIDGKWQIESLVLA